LVFFIFFSLGCPNNVSFYEGIFLVDDNPNKPVVPDGFFVFGSFYFFLVFSARSGIEEMSTTNSLAVVLLATPEGASPGHVSVDKTKPKVFGPCPGDS
jgi:hypothetical protein